MSRSYKRVRLKKHRVYSVEDLMAAFRVSRNTVSNWVQSGLQRSDEQKPYLFRGAIVTAFLKERHRRAGHRLGTSEFFCMVCKEPVVPHEGSIVVRKTERGGDHLSARCSECNGPIYRFANGAETATKDRARNPNTREDSIHEGKHQSLSGIGNCRADIWLHNDRIIYDWQRYAERYSIKTIDRHLAAIRFMESVLKGKRFDRLTTGDVWKVRDALKALLSGASATRRSPSTIRHKASHLRDFLTWLLKQKFGGRLPQDLPENLHLPKSAFADCPPASPREYPSLEEAEGLLSDMPSYTLAEKRARAIFAIAFLGALRADTIISLRLKHVEVDARRIVQDGSVSRTKNGKSLIITWFPLPEIFADVVLSWVETMKSRGLRPDDALFPSLNAAGISRRIYRPTAPKVEPMTSTHAVSQAFFAACRDQSHKYSPHAAKDTIASERDRRRLTAEQRKAWSQNMGHENEQITDRYYGKLAPERCHQLIEAIGETNGEGIPFSDFSDEELGALMRPVFDQLKAGNTKFATKKDG